MSIRGYAVIVALAALAAGCSKADSGPPRVEVKGKVTYNGTPISDGTIAFYPERGEAGIPTSTPIKEGEYRVEGRFGVAPGTYRVEFKSFRPGAKPANPDGIERPAGSGFETREQILPDKFHANSTERLIIKGDEKALEKDFHLKD